ncbi:MAG: hypothetical protein Q8S84_05260 [bacterium]|nr:hypothetical protein [bacterium]MDP3380902.1 hypothetical protein [bacterium]
MINLILNEDSNSRTFELIYDIFKNSKIKNILVEMNISKDIDLITSVLPLESEFS